MARKNGRGHLKTALAAQWAGLVNKSADDRSLYHITSSDSSTSTLNRMQYSAREAPGIDLPILSQRRNQARSSS